MVFRIPRRVRCAVPRESLFFSLSYNRNICIRWILGEDVAHFVCSLLFRRFLCSSAMLRGTYH